MCLLSVILCTKDEKQKVIKNEPKLLEKASKQGMRCWKLIRPFYKLLAAWNISLSFPETPSPFAIWLVIHRNVVIFRISNDLKPLLQSWLNQLVFHFLLERKRFLTVWIGNCFIDTIRMRFRFCGDLDCPTWVLAEMQTLSNLVRCYCSPHRHIRCCWWIDLRVLFVVVIDSEACFTCQIPSRSDFVLLPWRFIWLWQGNQDRGRQCRR